MQWTSLSDHNFSFSRLREKKYRTSGKLVPLDIPLRFRNRYVSIKKRSGKGHRKVVCAPSRPSVCCWGSRPWMNALKLFLSFNTSDTTSWIKFHLLYDLWCNRFDVGADEIYILFLVWHSRPVSLISKEELVNRARNRLKYHSTQVATNYRFNVEFANRIEGGLCVQTKQTWIYKVVSLFNQDDLVIKGIGLMLPLHFPTMTCLILIVLIVKPGFHIVVSVVSVVSVVRKKFIGQIEFILSCTTSCSCHFFCIEHLYGRFP